MGLNCKPGQRAWINVTPQTPQIRALGIDRLHGHVVQVVGLHPKGSVMGPQWVVDPPQWCVVPFDVRRHDGSVMYPAGIRFNFEAVPDAYLRPFDDFPPEEEGLRDRLEELEREGIA